MKPYLRLILIGLLFLLLGLGEHCIGPLWWGCNPPALLCAVVVCSMFSGEKAAALFGLFSGLFADAMTTGIFGLRAVLFLIFGYMIAFLGETVLSRNVFSCTLAGILSVALSELAVWGLECLSAPVHISDAAQYVFMPRILMALPVLLLLYLIFTLLFRDRDGYVRRR